MTAASVAAIRGAWRCVSCVAGLAWFCCAAGSAHAETWMIAGMSFSDRPGGARLLAASGTGTRDDPIVLVEEISGPGPAVLEIHNGRTGQLDVSPATGFLTLSVVKIIANRGPWRWSGFDLELMTGPDQPSVYADGLSFDQPQAVPRQARADRFLQTAREDEPFDRIRFDGGQVDPGQYLRLDFDLVDVNGTAVFYLVQRPITLIAWDVPPPSSGQLAALGGLGSLDLADSPLGERSGPVGIDTTRSLLTMRRSWSPALPVLGDSSILPDGRTGLGGTWIFGSMASGRS